ncbi:Ca2+-binding protein, RTX toxin-related [Paracoccus alcaliphilus]|uniref:Ca2+-binding protein, RTX toxin-related n=1 Tax=Paracoccus alcaliphilus TaxID=34002 RepID=A0A1H8FX79_9RHOB|nr:Calx-beta domain-containing protein [Paracoccus alcaliphilus]SEN35837.1 Ca2+-binding protein, RTX toxin-related [Paracoccus alcaliphilus]
MPDSLPFLSMEAARAPEGQQMTFTVRLSEPATDAVTVNYDTMAGTAIRNSDFRTASGSNALSGTLTFAPGETVKTLRFYADNDRVDELDESLFLELRDPSGATFGDGNVSLFATGWVLDNDGPGLNRTVAVSNAIVKEVPGGSNAIFGVEISQAADVPLTLNYSTEPGTARAGSDFTARSGQITFQPGQTRGEVAVPIIYDLVTEGAEQFYLRVAPPFPSQISAQSSIATGTATIMDGTVSGTNADDILHGTSFADRIEGLGGNDLIYGYAGNDILSGGAGNDTLIGGAGRDTLIGGAGDDLYIIDRQDVIQETANGGTDTIQANFSYRLGAHLENLTLTGNGNLSGTGNELNNVIVGNSGNNRLVGGAGNDTLRGGGGNDTLTGGAGNDRLEGGAGHDRLAGKAGNDTLLGGGGHDTLLGEGGNDLLRGGAGNDLLRGGAGNDRLFGDAGNDTLEGGNGNDQLEGGAGNDALLGGGGNDTLLGGAGNDRLVGGAGNDRLNGGGGNDTLMGGGGNDTLMGGNGDDLLNGGAGRDRLTGGAGNDTLQGGGDNDTLLGGGGNDTLRGGAGNDLLRGNAGNDRLFGDAGNDTLEGGAGNDRLVGGAGADLLRGGAGNDILIGGAGADRLHGGAGRDTFVFQNFNDSRTGASNRDVILDFTRGQDRLDLSALDANTRLAGNQDFSFNGTQAAAHSVWFVQQGNNVILRGDHNGDGSHDFEIQLNSIARLTVDDFIF